MVRIVDEVIIKAFCSIDPSPLERLENNLIFSFKSKNELIMDLSKIFDTFKSNGITSLTAKPSKCNYCYPTGKAYSFHNPDTDEFVIRYVIHQESEKVFRVEECRNIPPRKDGMPF